jgi:hypothetical protein
MKSLALDLDSGRLSRWTGDPRSFGVLSDVYGDIYTLRVHLYRSGGSAVPSVSLQFLVKKPHRRDVAALWKLNTFNRVPSFTRKDTSTYVGQVSVTGASYRDALKLDASPGNDLPKADFLGIIRVVSSGETLEAEFEYEIKNSGYRLADADFSGVYVGVSDTGGLLVRNIDADEWRELVVTGDNGNETFTLGGSVLGPVATLDGLSDDYIRVSNGVLQIKNDDNGDWVNVLLRGTNGTTIALGETPGVGFSLNNDRYKIAASTGRLLVRNLDTGNWHEARIQEVGGQNVLALGNEYEDSTNL